MTEYQQWSTLWYRIRMSKRVRMESRNQRINERTSAVESYRCFPSWSARPSREWRDHIFTWPWFEFYRAIFTPFPPSPHHPDSPKIPSIDCAGKLPLTTSEKQNQDALQTTKLALIGPFFARISPSLPPRTLTPQSMNIPHSTRSTRIDPAFPPPSNIIGK